MKKMLKKIKVNISKSLKTFLALVMITTEVLSPLSVLADAINIENIKKGDVFNPISSEFGASASMSVNSVTTTDEGNVKVTKTVSKTQVDGRYEVKFRVEGSDVSNMVTTVKPIYVVIVFDRSGSMICDSSSGGYSNLSKNLKHYTAADGVSIACLSIHNNGKKDSLIADKWEKAISGAQSFADSLVAQNNTYISLVTFSDKASNATDFRDKTDVVSGQSIFPAAEFGHPVGSTNLKDGIDKAFTKLNSITDNNAQKYIVVVGDGEPTAGGSNNCDATCAAKNAANTVKNNGIKVFSIGYGIDGNTEAQNVLKYVSSNTKVINNKSVYTDNGYYLEASTSGIVDTFQTVFESIGEPSLAGTDAVLKDNLGVNFSFVDTTDDKITDSGRSYTYNVGDITEDGTEFTFLVDIDQDSPTGLHDVNAGFTLSYTDFNDEEQELDSIDDPQVYWVQNTYPYEVRYYKDTITNTSDTTNYLGNVTGTGVNGDVINIDVTKLLPEGYVSVSTNQNSLTISNNSDNIVNILYVKRTDLSYIVRYYKDSISSSNKLGEDVVVNGQTFGSAINESAINKDLRKPVGYLNGVISTVMPITITTGDNVINVVYSKARFGYTVKYFYENVSYINESDRYTEDTSLRTSSAALFGDEITTYTPHLKTGFSFYKVNPTKLIISENADNNVMNVYYVRNNYQFTIKHLYEDSLGNYVEDEDYTINSLAKFGSVIDSDDQTKHEIDGYVFDSVDPEQLEITDKDNQMDFYYNLRTNLNYIVRYYKDNISTSNKLGEDVVVNGQTFGSTISESAINKDLRKPVGYQGGVIDTVMPITITTGDNVINVVYSKRADLSYTIRYYKDIVDSGCLIDSITFDNIIYGTVIELSDVNNNWKRPYGYLEGVILNTEDLVIDLENNYIDVLYNKDSGELVEEDLYKLGDRILTNVSNGVNYTISYTGLIEDYVGDATLTIIDRLPYTIDITKSDIGDGIYDADYNTITFVVNKDISEEDREISFEQDIIVVYNEISDNVINNIVESSLVFGNEKYTRESDAITEVLEGEIIVKYVDTENNELADSITMSDLVGNDYSTEELVIEGYTLVETPSNANGKYAEETTIVTYVYDKDGMGNDEEPPQTGVDGTSSVASFILLGALIIIKKLFR